MILCHIIMTNRLKILPYNNFTFLLYIIIYDYNILFDVGFCDCDETLICSTRFQIPVRISHNVYTLYTFKCTNKNIYTYIILCMCTHMAYLQNYSIWFSRQKQTARPKTLLVEETPTNYVVAVVGCICVQ